MLKKILPLIRLLAYLLILTGSQPSWAFDLFDPQRGVEKPPPPPAPKPVAKKPPPPPPKKPKPMPPQKDFSLQGVTQLGKNYTVYLQAPDNKLVRVAWRKGQKKPLSGFNDYVLYDVKPRQVKLDYPKDSTCRKSNEAKGVRCLKKSGGAELDLRRGKPTAPQVHIANTQPANQGRLPVPPQPSTQAVTPKRTVIKPEDVPPGMKVVRTPFGDRLVPIK